MQEDHKEGLKVFSLSSAVRNSRAARVISVQNLLIRNMLKISRFGFHSIGRGLGDQCKVSAKKMLHNTLCSLLAVYFPEMYMSS